MGHLKYSTGALWRRFELIEKDNEEKLLKLITSKSLTREELLLILNTIKVRRC